MSEEEVKIRDLIEHIRFGTQLKYDMRSYILAIERNIRFIQQRKRKE